MSKKPKAQKRTARKRRAASRDEDQKKQHETASLGRLASARILNDCVEQFHVFSTTCDDVSVLLDAFQKYQDKILSVLQLRRPDTGDPLEADILLINSDWVLEQSCATHHEYWRYVPDLRLNRQSDGTIVQPKEREGVATYAVWISAAKKPGVVLAKNVHTSPATTFFEELPNPNGSVIKYRAANVGPMYREPQDGPPPYKCILSVPITRIIGAHGDPLKQPVLECLGVLNLTHSRSTAFSQEDFAWAMTCTSLLGSLHASLYAKLPKDGAEHPNELLLESRRKVRKKKVEIAPQEMATRVPKIESVERQQDPGDNCFTKDLLRQGHIEPWDLLEEKDYLETFNKIDGTAEKTILDHLEKHGFVLVRMNALTPATDLLKSLQNSLGPACPEQNDYNGAIKLITPDPDKEAISGESGKELAAHVDGTQDSPLPPAMLAFQYLEGATHGGHSTFFDMADVLRDFRPDERATIIVDLAQHDAAQCTKEKTQKDGPPWVKTYQGPLVKPVCSDVALSFRVRFDRVMKIAPQYQASFDKLQNAVLARDEAKRITFLPNEGDVAIFDNWRVMHGRLEVAGRHKRHHHRVWLKDLVTRHKKTLLGVRGLTVELLHAVKQANAEKRS